MTKRKIFNKKTFYIFVLLICCLFTSMFSCSNIVFAEETEEIVYSDVLSDFQNDESFDVNNYPVDLKDYSLQVIQVAESVNNELFVYVYQPSGEQIDLQATSINISTTTNEDLSFINYKLSLLNAYDTLYKYKVEDFTVTDSATRYYEISSIYRPYNEYFDSELEIVADNEINEVAFNVSKQFKFETSESDDISMSASDVDTVEVTSRYDGFIEYPNGFKWFASDCNAYFVAFSTDKNIDYLLEADVYYTEKEYTTQKAWGSVLYTNYGDPVEKYAYLTYDSIAENSPGIGNKYVWNRIESISDFKAGLEEDDVTLSEDAELNLQGKEWVLRFAETEIFTSPITFGNQSINGTIIENVSVLRLAFLSNGEYYNLGVIDNKVSADLEPDGTIKSSLPWWVWLILAIVLLLILSPFLPAIFSFLWVVVKFIFNGVWWLITAPFSIFDD